MDHPALKTGGDGSLLAVIGDEVRLSVTILPQSTTSMPVLTVAGAGHLHRWLLGLHSLSTDGAGKSRATKPEQ